MNNCIASKNTALYGGFIYSGKLKTNNSSFYRNQAVNGGGTIYSCTSELNNCFLENNTAGWHGAFYQGSATLNNCIISNNGSAGFGGGSSGAYNFYNTIIKNTGFYVCDLKFINCIINNPNIAFILSDDNSAGGTYGETEAYNTFFVGNLWYDAYPSTNAVTVTADHCYFSDTTLPPSANISNSILGFVTSDFTNYAGDDYHIGNPNSTAINGGANQWVDGSLGTVLSSDRDNRSRIIGTYVDVGIYETFTPEIITYQGNIVAKNHAQRVTLNWSAPTSTGSAINHYQYYFGPLVSGNTVTATTNATYILDPFQYKGTNYFRVRAVNELGYTGTWSTVWQYFRQPYGHRIR